MSDSSSGIKRIAKLANVSIGTVDRVLHNRPGVADKTREKILKIIKELDYKPNIIARRLVSKRKFYFAVILPTPSKENPYWKLHEEGIRKAESEINQLGVFVERLSFNQDDSKSFVVQAKKVMQGNYDGVLLLPYFYSETIKLMDFCKTKNIPCTFIDTNLIARGKEPLSFIGQDAFKSGYFAGQIISYLLDKNDIALSMSINTAKKADNHVNYLRRQDGFINYSKTTKHFKVFPFEYNSPDMKGFEKQFLELIQEKPDIKAIFVTNSRAYKLAAILEKKNLTHFKILGYDVVEQNVEFLKKGFIDFLISQEPLNQGYSGVMALYTKLILNQEVQKQNLMPLTIITKENLDFYKGHLFSYIGF